MKAVRALFFFFFALLLYAATQQATDFLATPRGSKAGETGRVRLYELKANGEHSVDLKAPDSLSATTPYTLPDAYPASNGYALQSTTAGVLSWAPPSSTPGRISILDWHVLPDSSGNVFFQIYTATATNDFWKQGNWVFNNPSADEKLYGSINIPSGYAGSSLSLIVVWTSTITSGNFGIEFAYRCVGGNDSESLDQSTAQETVNTTDVAPGATDRRMEVSISLTASNCAANDTMEFYFARDDSADTLAGTVLLVDLLLDPQ